MNSAAAARPEIALAWRRAALAGLEPGMPVRDMALADVDRDSRLMAAAAPVLDRLMSELADTRFSVLLADRDARIIDRRPGQSGLDRALDRACAVPGFRYVEEVTGTNSLATAYELRQPISVVGEEHFLDELKSFCCHGAPIVHPLTRRLEGVLDISGPAAEMTPLLAPFVVRASRDIEQQLLAGSRMAEQRLLAEFQSHIRRKRHAVLAFDENVVLGNGAAMELLSSADHGTLRVLAEELFGTAGGRLRGSLQRAVVLSSGADVMVRAREVPGCPGGVVFDVVELPAAGRPLQQPCAAGAVLVVGEPGTGRSTRACELAGSGSVQFEGDFDVVRDATATGRTVLIDDVQLLDNETAGRLAALFQRRRGGLVMTSSPLKHLDSEQAALASLAVEHVELPPLRTCRDDFAHRATQLLRHLHPDTNMRLTGTALCALAAQPWPGNLRELAAVLSYATRHRSCGDITEHDLPPAYRNVTNRPMSPIELAERDTILAELRNKDGNKAAAAAALGIARATLYARLQRYGISA